MIIFLYGGDSFRIREKRDEMIAKFRKDVDMSGHNISVLDGERLTMAQFRNAFAGASLFVRRRMVILQDLTQNKDKEFLHELSAYLSKETENENPDSNILIVVESSELGAQAKTPLFKLLLSLKFKQYLPPLAQNEVPKWIMERAASKGLSLHPADAQLIAGRYHGDLWTIDSELAKLQAFRSARRKASERLDKDDEAVLSPGAIDENIFALTDAISNRERAKATELLERELAAGQAELYLLNMISKQFRNLIAVRSLIDQGINPAGSASPLKMHPYVLQKCQRQARAFEMPKLKAIYGKLIDLDREIKSGRADFHLSLDLILMSI